MLETGTHFSPSISAARKFTFGATARSVCCTSSHEAASFVSRTGLNEELLDATGPALLDQELDREAGPWAERTTATSASGRDSPGAITFSSAYGAPCAICLDTATSFSGGMWARNPGAKCGVTSASVCGVCSSTRAPTRADGQQACRARPREGEVQARRGGEGKPSRVQEEEVGASERPAEGQALRRRRAARRWPGGRGTGEGRGFGAWPRLHSIGARPAPPRRRGLHRFGGISVQSIFTSGGGWPLDGS